MTGPRSRARTASALPAGLVLLNAALLVGALALDLAASDADRELALAGYGSVTGLPGLALVVSGAVVLRSLPGHRVGLVLAGFGTLWCLDGFAESWTAYGYPAGRPGTDLAYWVVARLGAALLLALPLVLVLYPDGRLVPGRWRWAGLLAVALAVPLPVMLLLASDEVVLQDTDLVGVRTELVPLPLPEDVVVGVLTTALPLAVLAMLGGLLVVLARYRTAGEQDRTRLRWLLWAGVVVASTVPFLLAFPRSIVGTVALDVVVVVVAASVALGILRPDIADIDDLVANTLTFAVLAGGLVALDLAVLTLAGRLLGDELDERRVTVLLLVGALLVYGPLRSTLSAQVRRALFGRRGDRYGVVSQLAARLEQAGGIEEQLPALVTTLASAFKVPFVRVEVLAPGAGTLVATSGEVVGETTELDIAYGGRSVGRLVLPRHGLRARLSRRDQDLLLDLVRQAAIAVRTSSLARELQESRERLVLAREDDRRRIRRDLHDGLGPVLGGVAMRLEAAASLLEAGRPDRSARAVGMVRQSAQDITDALRDVRRLVHGLRPPALDDLGLLAAVEQQAERLRGRLDVAVRASHLEQLPAAVEVAAYRIVSEALANAGRHSGATRCTVTLRGPQARPGTLEVCVHDDGRGIPEGVPAGVGLLSLRERAEELGGQCTVTCPADGGTVVRASLPCGAAEDVASAGPAELAAARSGP